MASNLIGLTKAGRVFSTVSHRVAGREGSRQRQQGSRLPPDTGAGLPRSHCYEVAGRRPELPRGEVPSGQTNCIGA